MTNLNTLIEKLINILPEHNKETYTKEYIENELTETSNGLYLVYENNCDGRFTCSINSHEAIV